MRKILLFVLLGCLVGAGGCVSKHYKQQEKVSQVMMGEGYPIVFAKAAANGVLDVSTFQCESGSPTVCMPYFWRENSNGKRIGFQYMCYTTDSEGKLNGMFDAKSNPVGDKLGSDFTEKSLSCGAHECRDYLTDDQFGRFWNNLILGGL